MSIKVVIATMVIVFASVFATMTIERSEIGFSSEHTTRIPKTPFAPHSRLAPHSPVYSVYPKPVYSVYPTLP